MTGIYRESGRNAAPAKPPLVLEARSERFGCAAIFMVAPLIVLSIYLLAGPLRVEVTCTRGAQCVVHEVGLVFAHEVKRFPATDLRDASATTGRTGRATGVHLVLRIVDYDLPQANSPDGVDDAVRELRVFVNGAEPGISVIYGCPLGMRVFFFVILLGSLTLPVAFLVSTSYRLVLTDDEFVVERRRLGILRGRERYAYTDIKKVRADRGYREQAFSICVETAYGEACVAAVDADVKGFLAELQSRIPPFSVMPCRSREP
jgi:hypothetical protein